MGEFFNSSVLPPVWPGQKVTAVAIEDIAYRAGKRCEILYALQFANPAPGQPRWAVVTFAREHKLWEIYRCCYGGDGSASPRPTPCPVVLLPESRCLVEFFPMDWGLPGLIQATDPELMAPLLSQVDLDGDHVSSHQLLKIEMVQYRLHTKRCVLRYVLDSPASGGPKEVIGKVFASESMAVEAAHTLNLLYPQATACGLIIPKPLGVVKEGSLLLIERLPGTVLNPVEEQAKASEHYREVVGLAAATLASLHRLQFESQEVQSLQTLVEKLRERAALLQLVAPLLAQEVETLLQQIVQLGAQCTAVAHSFIHADFSPDQLLMDKGQMAVIDFDLACLGDPALDVGNFMAILHYIAVCQASNAFRQLAAYFLSKYQARLPEHGVADRIHLFLSAALVRRALREFEMRPYDYDQAGPDSLPVRLLQEAAACLARR